MKTSQCCAIYKFYWARLMMMVLATGSFLIAQPVSARVIKVSLAQLPVLSESPSKGVLIDMIRAMEEFDPQNRYEIVVLPFARSLLSVQDGKADVHMPLIRPPNEAGLPFKLSKKINFYKVNFVLYSNKNRKLDINNLQNYKIETDNAHANFFNFPVQPVSTIESGLVKVNLMRSDGYIYGDVATDPVLKERGFRNIHRSFYGAFDVTAVYNKNSNDDVDTIMASALEKLRVAGRLEAIFGPVTSNYVDWQMPD